MGFETYENRIEVTIDVDMLDSKPYYLKFDYLGDLDFKKRLLAVAADSHYQLEIDVMMFNWILVSFLKRPYYKQRKFHFPNLQELLAGEITWSIQFGKEKHAELARLKTETELNKFIAKEWEVYNDLCSFKNLLKEES